MLLQFLAFSMAMTVGIQSLLAWKVSGLPEERLTAPEIISYWGYPCEVHEVTTDDGYVLVLHRIPHGLMGGTSRKRRRRNSQRPVFFLQHGLLASSADWITNLPHQSLGFMLADAGFDVWMGNVRGNFYSSRHVNLSRSDYRYWEFTWDEMSSMDLPVMIDKVLNVSGQARLYYLGHSQGTAIMFARLAQGDSSLFSKRIRKFFALAPVASVSHIKGLIALLAKYCGKHLGSLEWMFGSRDFLPHSWMTTLFARLICGQRWESPLCDNVLFQIGGPESAQFNQTRLMVYMAHTPAGTSTKNIIHWAQMQQSGRVQKFDFGSEKENLKHYGQRYPPIYNLSNVNVPVYFYYSESDWLADARDVRETLLQKVPKEWIKSAINFPHFNHFDFIWGLNAPPEIYSNIIKIASENHFAITGRRRFTEDYLRWEF